jgi:hypothetical protein
MHTAYLRRSDVSSMRRCLKKHRQQEIAKKRDQKSELQTLHEEEDFVSQNVPRCNAYKELALAFQQALFHAENSPPTETTFPHINMFSKLELPSFAWYEMEFMSFKDECLEGLDIVEQQENVKQYNAIVRAPWTGQRNIVIGCGHKFGHYGTKHNGEYTVDPSFDMGSDCLTLFGHVSLANIIPEAKGKIEKISCEGVIIQETPIFVRDLEFLLAENGSLINSSFDEPEILIRKVNGKLVMCNETPYIPWEIEFSGDVPHVVNLGQDVCGWRQQIDKVCFEYECGVYTNFPKNPKTPFDPCYGLD